MRCYDRGVSFLIGVIKIDELGNLVNFYVNGGRIIFLLFIFEIEGEFIGKVKEFWRVNFMGKYFGRFIECLVKRISIVLVKL